MPLQKSARLLLDLPRAAKRALALFFDAALCVLTVGLAFWLRLDEWVPFFDHPQWRPAWAAGASLVLALPLFVVSGFYRAIFRYAGWQASLAVARAMAIYGAIYAAIFTAIGVPGVPRSVGLLQPILLFLAVAGSRLLLRFWLGGVYQGILRRAQLPAALIYGAGEAGRQLAAALMTSHELRLVGFVDDDAALQGHTINGLPVHAPEDLPALVETLGVRSVLLAIPSASRRRRNEILQALEPLHVEVRTLPAVTELVQGKVSVADLREPGIEDLLGREPVPPEPTLLACNIRGKTVLVTGAGGSIGSELSRQIALLAPERLVLVEHSEYALYAIHQELRGRLPEERLVPILADVRDEKRMHGIMQAFWPQTVYHAAAYKHVPLVEHNAAEGVRNNVFGTLATAQAAQAAGVEDFVLISTDKAVRPTNVMGASKRLAEMVLQALTAEAGPTRFTMVRFGNVLDSSGSVVPLFRRQIREGGPVTLTHPEVTRYFMTIPEAAALVLQAGAMGQGGEVFLLDMGEPVKIRDLAVRMIELSGLTVKDEDHPEGEIEIRITGLRPGEKLYEELLIGDNPEPTAHPRIKKAREDFLPWPALQEKLAELDAALAEDDEARLRALLRELVSGYQPNGGQEACIVSCAS
ncbi:MAG: polysaccharide biosynthesis protein [Rhodocyclaceae bacterium]|nr:polysaccharide biosynthesis protein [Rhodocyclaceae bacterium]